MAKRPNVFKKLALEREAKRKAREAAGEPAPTSPYTQAQIDAARKIMKEDREVLRALAKTGRPK